MDETTDKIESQIESTRQDLGSNLNELENRFKSATDWKQHFRQRPMTMIGLAFGGGVLLAAMTGGGGNGGRRRGGTNAGYSGYSGYGNARTPNKVLETWDNIKGALMGVAASRVKDFVGDVVPGFHEHYERAGQTSGQSGENTKSTPRSGVAW